MRNLLGFMVLLVLVGCASTPQPVPTPLPTGTWSTLVDGNARFLGTSSTFGDLIRLREVGAGGQKPPFTVLACSDSRVPPELVFAQTLGQLFIVRSAGNVTDPLGIASIEYAIAKEYTDLLVILAHEKCGAVEEAINEGTPDSPNLEALVEKIRDSFSGPCETEINSCWERRTRQNAVYAVDDLKKQSDIIRKAIDVDKLPVVVAFYKLDGTLVVWQTIN